MKQIPWLLLPRHKRGDTLQTGKSQTSAILKLRESLKPKIERKQSISRSNIQMLESSMSSNVPETRSVKYQKLLMENGVTRMELNGVHSLTRLTGNLSYGPTETVKELVWDFDKKQYVERKQDPKQLNLEI